MLFFSLRKTNNLNILQQECPIQNPFLPMFHFLAHNTEIGIFKHDRVLYAGCLFFIWISG